MQAAASPRYLAFISYKHDNAPDFVRRLELALKQYGKPLLRRPFKIFRDEAHLVPGIDLTELIHNALDDSGFLILLASPGAALSPWVRDELNYWCGTLKRTANLLIVLTEGNIAVDAERGQIDWDRTTALPSMLQNYLHGVPFYVDMSGAATDTSLDLANAEFKRAINRISARLRGLDPNEMLGVEVAQHRKNVRLRNAAVGLLLVLTIAASLLAVLAELRRQETDLERRTLLAQKVAAQAGSQTTKQLDLALLLGTEALNIGDSLKGSRGFLLRLRERILDGRGTTDPGSDSRSALLSALQYSPQLRVFLRGGSRSAVASVALGGNGRMLATGYLDGTVALWDTQSPDEASRCEIGRPNAEAADARVSFGPGNNLLGIGWGQGSDDVIIWNVTSCREQIRLVGHSSGVESLAFSHDGVVVAVGGGDAITIWNLTRSDSSPWLQRSGLKRVSAIAFAPVGHMLASGSLEEDSILLWEATDRPPRRLQRPRVGREAGVRSVAFSPDGKAVASGGYDGAIALSDLASGGILSTLEGQEGTVFALAFSADGKTLVSSSVEGLVSLWDVEARRRARTLRGHHGPVYSLGLSGTVLASGATDGTVILWDTTAVEPLGTALEGHRNTVHDIAVTRDGRVMGSASGDGTIMLWDAKSFALIGQLTPTPRAPVLTLAFAPDGSVIAAAGRRGAIGLWDVRRRELIDTLSGHSDAVLSLGFSRDGRRLASGGRDGTIFLWDVTQRPGSGVPLVRAESGWTALAFHPDGQVLAASRADSIALWDVSNRTAIGEPLQHGAEVDAIAFSPNGKTLVSGGRDNLVKLWDVDRRQLAGRLVGHNNHIWSVAFGPDGNTLASGSNDDTIILWDVRERRALGDPFSGRMKSVRVVRFSPDGAWLFSGSNEPPVIMAWDMTLSSWKARACEIARRPLNQLEWSQYVADGALRRTCPGGNR